MDHKQDLREAIAALRQFRATFNIGETVNEESGLTADHLTTIVQSVETLSDDVVADDPEQG
jgi:hypothetical protein